MVSILLGAAGTPVPRRLMLASVSVVSVLLGSADVRARPLNGSGGGALAAPNIASDAATQAAQQAVVAARQTQSSLARAAKAMQDMQAVQAAARAAAAARQTSLTAPIAVPDGLGAGGLVPNVPVGWSGAGTPTQSVDGSGQTQVGIRQTQAQAILNWTSFNVGARTTLTYDQQGNRNWVALNRVNGATAPSQILGNIKADGQVYVINQSGIIFGGNSQINVGALIASTAGITDAQFRNNGIYSAQSGAIYLPSFTAAGGKVVVEAGASINTLAPASVTSGGGYVLLLGSEVGNAGSIATPKGQTILAAGDDFVLRRGFSTDVNTVSTTRGIEIAPVIAAGSTNGRVGNSGLVVSQQGDITLAGRSIAQDGALIATTTVNTRGTIHLLNSASDTAGSITLSGSGITVVLPELDSTETALDSQRDALIAASTVANLARAGSAIGVFDNLSLLADRQDQSRIEIVSGGTVTFKGGSYTAAQGGQIAVSATKRIAAEDGATLDASGVRNVALAMASNNVEVNVQGNELRDSPQNRDSDVLKNNDVWIDARDLTLVPAGTGGYASDRYYTAGGLLEVGGYLGTTAHTIGEWTAVGGSITLNAPEVIAQKGATFDISGGSLDYAAGWIRSTNLIGSDGRRYSVDNAPADLDFVNFAGGFSRTHNIQGQVDKRLTEIWTSVFNRGRTSLRWEEAYSVGRDAGRLILSTPTSVFEGTILADTINGERQSTKRAATATDGYKQTQTTVAQNGTLALGQYDGRGLASGADSDVVFGKIEDVTTGRNPETAGFTERKNTAWFDADAINKAGLGGLDITSTRSITVSAPLALADGGVVSFKTPNVTIARDLTAHGGNGKLAVINGGTLSVATTGGITLAEGGLIDVSSGVARSITGKLTGGRGGDVSLITNDFDNLADAGFYTTPRDAKLILDGSISGYGFTGGGTLTLNASQKIVIGGGAAAGDLQLDPALFASGFSAYDITGIGGIAIGEGTQIAPVVPVYRMVDAQNAEVWLPPVTTADAVGQNITRRAGADITLAATKGDFTLGQGASISVDPGHAVNIYAYGQTTIDGRITAQGGRILMASAQLFPGKSRQLGGNGVFSLTRSIWIGDTAVLDVSGYASTVTDTSGRSSGTVTDGGTIALGGADGAASDAFVIIRPGAVLDASGASATIDIIDGNTATPVLVASDGGTIALNSNNGIYIDGTLRAAAGGAGASGGTLSMNLVSRIYAPNVVAGPQSDIIGPVPEALRKLRNIAITQQREASGLGSGAQAGQADAGLMIGNAAISVDQITQGGFGSLSLKTADMFVFKGDLSLSLPRSLTLSGGLLVVADATPNIAVALAAPYVKIDGFTESDAGDGYYRASLHAVLSSNKPSVSSFSVAADLLDITGGVRFGAYGDQGSGWLSWGPNVSDHSQEPNDNIVDYAGFAQVSLTSRGDIRLGNGKLWSDSQKAPGGWIKTGGDLTLTAAQIYPMSGAAVQVFAGLVSPFSGRGTSPSADSFDTTTPWAITIRRSSANLPQTPASVFGNLVLSAPVIGQGGVLRAPLGTIGFNGIDAMTLTTSAVTFRAGSITSASANGLIMPFGGTSDGISYQGADGTLHDLAAMLVPINIVTGVSVAGTSVVAEPGSLLDVSGGGTLTGAGFVSGRGGSVDVLKTALVNANPAYANISAKTDQVYAILPGYASAYAPLVATNGAGDPVIGRQITIPAGVPGLPAGTYTLCAAARRVPRRTRRTGDAQHRAQRDAERQLCRIGHHGRRQHWHPRCAADAIAAHARPDGA
ncbi:filamentous hemagglutinin N-terminal domain-containing protein [Bradyrhizobium sp. Arg237L]|uniref:two-partner secretion domain-containing protein n=1 Tax=Bradyrhizobium sp. Arg237L TaxID=3003352 RepID=UPI00249F32D1|nr:filamentous hemagglutinin N-terminal domain-containing protein [Bradyrhizobium sp. Arg237L]MDI4231967.1 filamentous hemagglutinin N-terminal domain-containing protein [Bradyrhizobium sp. Arg237L]